GGKQENRAPYAVSARRAGLRCDEAAGERPVHQYVKQEESERSRPLRPPEAPRQHQRGGRDPRHECHCRARPPSGQNRARPIARAARERQRQRRGDEDGAADTRDSPATGRCQPSKQRAADDEDAGARQQHRTERSPPAIELSVHLTNRIVSIGVLSVLLGGSVAAKQTSSVNPPAPASETAAVARGWTLLAEGRAAPASQLAADLLRQFPRSVAVGTLFV